MLAKTEDDGQLHSVTIYRREPSISNLLFVVDSLLFFQENQEEVQVIFDTLQLYAIAFDQCINFEKSLVYFSSNTIDGQKNWIKDTLGVKEVDRFESYLGLQTLIGRAKYHTFSFLKERLWKKITRLESEIAH